MIFSEIIYTPELTAGQISTIRHLVKKKIDIYKIERVAAKGLDKDRIDNNIRIMEDILKSLEDATKDEP